MSKEGIFKHWRKVLLGLLYVVMCYLAIIISALIIYVKEGDTFDIDLIQAQIFRFVLKPTEMRPYMDIVLMIFMVLFFTVLFLSIWFMAINTRQTYKAGEEHGTAKWGRPEDINNVYADERPEYNHILSENIRVSIDDRKYDLNRHMAIIGGSGRGKTMFCILPNILQAMTSLLITDPAGEILRMTGNYLIEQGYDISVLNITDMLKSDCFNAFFYARGPEEIDMLINIYWDSTTPPDSQKSDPFWDLQPKTLFMAVVYYVYRYEPKENFHLPRFSELLNEIIIDNKPWYMSKGFSEKIKGLPSNDPAYVSYNQAMSGSADTNRSVLAVTQAHFNLLGKNKELDRILSADQMNLYEFGTGINNNPKRKKALFCIVPDNGDKTYSFLVEMLYEVFFRVTKDMGDTYFESRLPVPIQCWFDELANIHLPAGFTEKLSTLRKRNIGISMIFQSISQPKALFKENWPQIFSNSDTFVFLGCSNDPDTNKYVSEDILGSATCYQSSQGHNYGSQESASTQVSSYSRNLQFADEVGRLKKQKCIVKVGAEYPVLENKYKTFNTPKYKHAMELGKYVHYPKLVSENPYGVVILSTEAMSQYKNMGEIDENYQVKRVTMEALFDYLDTHTDKDVNIDEIAVISKQYRAELKAEADRRKKEKAESKKALEKKIESKIASLREYSPEQIQALTEAKERGVPKDIMDYLMNPDLTPEEMRFLISDLK